MAVVTTSELADAAGVTVQRIYQYHRKGMPQVGRNQWDSELCMKWLADFREDHVGTTSRDINDLRARLYQLQGDAQEIRNEVLRGNVVLVETALNAVRQALAELVNIHDAHIAKGRNAAEQEWMTTLSHEIRDASSRAIEGMAEHFSRGEDVAATRVRYGRRVGG